MKPTKEQIERAKAEQKVMITFIWDGKFAADKKRQCKYAMVKPMAIEDGVKILEFMITELIKKGISTEGGAS